METDSNPNQRLQQATLTCKRLGCGKRLAPWNKSGYCHKHSKNLGYKHRRKLPGARWGVCKYCTRRVRSDSKSGCCGDHHFRGDRPPSKRTLRFCEEPGCGRRLHGANKGVYCDQHKYAKNRPSVESAFCRECGERLGTNNESGYCNRHLYLSTGSQNARAKFKIKVKKALLLLAEQERPKAKKKRGPAPQPEESKSYFVIGLEVERRIPRTMKYDRHTIVDARRFVAADRRMDVDVVAQYHKNYRQFCKRSGIEFPS